MKTVNIEIFPIAKTEVQPDEVQNWLRHLNASEAYIDDVYEQVMEEEAITNPALLIAMAAKRCYMSFEAGMNPNVTKVRKDFTEYLDNVLKSGHGSVLEHATYTFAIEGVSRVFTGEMNRHRAGVAISEGSMRFIRFTDIPYWLPTSIALTPEEQALKNDFEEHPDDYEGEDEDAEKLKLIRKKTQSQSAFRKVFGAAEEGYKELLEIWKEEMGPDSPFKDKKHITSMMRRVIPMGVATGGVWTMNLRAVRHVMALRSSPAAEEEILHVFSRICKIMIESEPMLCGDFHQDENGYWVPKYSKV
jgi:thymidylate synthase (FAD)